MIVKFISDEAQEKHHLNSLKFRNFTLHLSRSAETFLTTVGCHK